MESINEGFHALWQKLETWVVHFIEALPNILIALAVFIGFIFLSSWIYNLMRRMFGHTHLKPSLEHLLANVVKTVVICIGALFALSIMQLDKVVFSMLAGVGVVGLALGFAFQDLASNFISGLILAVRAPFQVKDMVDIGGTRGTVVDVRLRDTVLKNADGQHIFIPNKEFMSNRFMNFSSFGVRKVAANIGVSYEDDLRSVKETILKAISSLPGILKDPAPDVKVDNFAESSITLAVDVWVTYPGTDVVQTKDEMLIAIKYAMDEKGFSLPYAIRNVVFSESLEKALAGNVKPE